MYKRIEKKTSHLLRTGMLATLGLTLMAFEWADFDRDILLKTTTIDYNDDKIYETPKIVKLEEPKPKKLIVANQKQEIIDIVDKVDDDTKLKDDIILIDSSKFKVDVDVDVTLSDVDGIAPIIDIDNGIKTMDQLNVDPQYIGGFDKMYEFLGKHLQYPSILKAEHISDKVWVQFVIEKDGSVSDVKAIKSGYDVSAKEAERVVKMLPKWTSGEIAGKKVRVRYTLPVIFRSK